MVATTELIQQPEVRKPIPEPSDRLQYRAIGLLWGKYIPEDGITQGNLTTSDGSNLSAVILGKLLSLIESRQVDLEKEHLWVVYPRAGQQKEQPRLHVQLVGIWEPATLQPDTAAPTLEQKPDYFSIRGEVVYQHQSEGWVVVRIIRQPKKPSEKPKFFKLKLFGSLPEKAVKNFWDLQVQREGNNLVIKESERIAYIGKRMPKKQPYLKKPRPRYNSSNTFERPIKVVKPPTERPKLKNLPHVDTGTVASVAKKPPALDLKEAL